MSPQFLGPRLMDFLIYIDYNNLLVSMYLFIFYALEISLVYI
jgi:hypothetical protein